MAAATMAGRILQGDAAWAWDPAVLAWSGNEVELQFEGQLLRLDRLLQRRDNGQWWVLDYKSAWAPQADPQLRSQLSNYSGALRSIYPGALVKAAFLTAQGRFIELEEGA
jgi:ATP-dependent helicase/nuclease subunit A